MPLTIAMDIAKRLNHELAKHMSPEQRRDFARVERLIDEAQATHRTELARIRQSSVAAKSGAQRKGYFGR